MHIRPVPFNLHGNRARGSARCKCFNFDKWAVFQPEWIFIKRAAKATQKVGGILLVYWNGGYGFVISTLIRSINYSGLLMDCEYITGMQVTSYWICLLSLRDEIIHPFDSILWFGSDKVISFGWLSNKVISVIEQHFQFN